MTPSALGILVTVAVLAAATCVGLWRRGREGRMRTVDTPAPETATLAALGVEPGAVTLLQFSSAFCAPCRATRRTLGEVAEMVPGVAHLEVDAELHLELVRRLGILRTPTTLVLDGGGLEVARAAGAPRKEQVLRALGALQ